MGHLGGNDEDPADVEGNGPSIEGLGDIDDHNSIRRSIPKSIPGVGEDGDEHVLLHIERPRVQRHLSISEPELPAGEDGGEEVAGGEGGDLNGDLCDDQWLRTVGEELVEEGHECAR